MHSAPSMLAKAVNLEEHKVTLLAPVLDLAAGNEKVLSAIYEIGLELGHTREECSPAIEKSAANMKDKKADRGKDKSSDPRPQSGGVQSGNKQGRGSLLSGEDIENSDKPVFVVLARGYCAKDNILN